MKPVKGNLSDIKIPEKEAAQEEKTYRLIISPEHAEQLSDTIDKNIPAFWARIFMQAVNTFSVREEIIK